MTTTHIAFIGFGEAGRSWASSLGASGGVTIAAYDIAQDGTRREEFARAARERSVALAVSPEEATRGARAVFSAVTASESLEAARSVAAALGPGQVFFDINSVSPGRKRETAAVVAANGATYVDMAVMAPVHSAGHQTPVLVAGDVASDVEQLIAGLGFVYEVAGEAPGDATMVKMIRSLFVKGLEALTIEALTAAEAAGCRDRILASLSKSYPGLGWERFPAYQFERVATHGVRRAEEMRESAATLRELGRREGASLAQAIADAHAAVGALGLDLKGVSDPAVATRKVLGRRE